jgi:signal transduction histidine kinase
MIHGLKSAFLGDFNNLDSDLPPEKIGCIFEAFKRGEVHGQRGVGLGLSIASQAAKHLGAEQTVDSELGIGSTFRLKLISELKRETIPQGKVVMT